jgi:predicted TIM-barrel fold metal-dependent hydrolase
MRRAARGPRWAMTIDMHAHWNPKEFNDALRARTEKPMITRGDDGREYLESGFSRAPLIDGCEDVEQRIAEMDRNGVARAVLSLTTVYGVERLPVADALPLCRAFNDAVAAACRAYPDRFSGLAALPVAEIDIGLAEFERVMALPGFVGALLPSDGFLSLRRAEKFRPILAAADRHGALLLVHYGKIANDPDAPHVDSSDNGGYRVGTLDMQSRLSSNMITFCLTDLLAAYPNATVLSHNLGGNIPSEVERLDHRCLIDNPGQELPSKRIRAARVLVDCNSLGARSIERAVEAYGAERIVFGSDGTDFGMNWSNKAIADARISDAEKRAILEGNAAAALSRVHRQIAAAAE